MSDEMRLDALLVQRGMVGGRDRAKELILQGKVLVNGIPARKPAQPVSAADDLQVDEAEARLVSRAAHKLEGALDVFSIDLRDKTVLDIGASTGGFTQIALERGAKTVYAVDVGKDQLAEALRHDPRVRDLQQTDARALRAEMLDETPDLFVCDVSFISLRLVLPGVMALLPPEGEGVALIKPQFEAGRAAVGRGGLVKDVRTHKRVLGEMLDFFAQNGMILKGLIPSPIRGGDGNVEYLAWLGKSGTAAVIRPDELAEQALRHSKKEVSL